MTISWTICALVSTTFLAIILKYRRFLKNLIKTLPRDLHGLYVYYIRLGLFVFYCKYTNQTIPSCFDSTVKKHPHKPCFYFKDEVWTYKKVQDETYKIANYFQSLGYKNGDAIALCMENKPEYVCIWLGLSRIGVTTCLLNYNLRLQSLEHCVTTGNCKAVIFGTELTSAIQEIVDYGGFQTIKLFSFEDREKPLTRLTAQHTVLTKELETTVAVPPTLAKGQEVKSSNIILNIYTSGTTGLPKAVLMTHSRMFTYSGAAMITLNSKDILITPLPLYHVQGGVIGVTSAILCGIPQVIIKKFSASNFWNECIKYDATAAQYMGEIIRYLYNQPTKPIDTQHKVKKFLGNGVNPEIWAKFVKRFNNVKMHEMYGSTEGNCNIMNITGKIGAVGFVPIFALRFLPMVLAKVNQETGELIRNSKTGLVQSVEIGECGELVSQVTSHPLREFNGYTDKAASEKKIVHGVKKQGDSWFRTGDFLKMDELGFLYFKDRTGDTFKWKGENVSTTEVEGIVTRSAGMRPTVVYGVTVTCHEGRCGMAAIYDPDSTLDLTSVASEVNKYLPSYARPLFIRIMSTEIQMTGTYKLQKLNLQDEGFDFNKITDPIWFLKNGNYTRLDDTLYQSLIKGEIRL